MNSILPILSKDSKFPQYICIQFYCFTLDLLLFMFEAFFCVNITFVSQTVLLTISFFTIIIIIKNTPPPFGDFSFSLCLHFEEMTSLQYFQLGTICLLLQALFFFSKSIQSFVVFSKIKRKRAHGISLKSLSLLDPKLTLRGHLLQRFLTQLPEDVQAYTNMHVSTDVTTPRGSQS